MMLATSSMASLVPVTAFAQEDIPDMQALLTQPSLDSTSEEDTSASEEDTSASEEDTSASEEDTSASEEDTGDNGGTDYDVIADPIVQTDVEADANVNADTHVITDEEDCDEANDEVNQANVQSADQRGRSDGEVGDNGVYVSPKVQTVEQVGLNINVDTDVIMVDGCNPPSDPFDQSNTQSSVQGTGSDVMKGEDSTVVIPAYQTSGAVARNIGINNDEVQPVL